MSKDSSDQMEKLLRAQRHDFINHFQVVHALLQLGRVEKALRYIEELSKDPDLVAKPLQAYREQQAAGGRDAGL
ncbi:MAG: Spo0B domain-containing protein [Negativicutes bacterium]|nr:Spo0B domain-containing protein [Negativicutes bacterium]